MFRLADGRGKLYQWDSNIKLLVDENFGSIDEVHFASRFSRASLAKKIVVENSVSYVIIPNILLTKSYDIFVYAYVHGDNGNYTKFEKTFEVISRPKPSSYIYTETDVLNYLTLSNRIDLLSEEIADGVSWNELKDKPFYLEKTLVVELTKDDFTVNDQDGRFKYMYRSTPKLDWFTSAESIAFEIEIVDTNGRRYTATQDSLDVYIERDTTYDDREYWSCYSDLFEIVSGVDLDYYDDDYYYKDEWGVLVSYHGIEFSGINIKIYRVDVKKIPEICLDAAIGKTAITVGSVLEDSEAEMSPSAIVPDLRIPISPSVSGEYIYCDRISKRLRISGDLFPYNGNINYTFRRVTPTTAGSSISFDISSEGDTLWDTIGWNSPWQTGGYLTFSLKSSYSGGGIIEFLSRGSNASRFLSAVASSNLGHLYTVVFEYTNSYKTLNVTIKCVV